MNAEAILEFLFEDHGETFLGEWGAKMSLTSRNISCLQYDEKSWKWVTADGLANYAKVTKGPDSWWNQVAVAWVENGSGRRVMLIRGRAWLLLFLPDFGPCCHGSSWSQECKALLFNVRWVGLQPQHHLGACKTCKMADPARDLLNLNLHFKHVPRWY